MADMAPGKQVVVVGGGNSATEESLLLTKFADRVTILVRGGEFKASRVIQQKVLDHPRIDVLWHTEVLEFVGAKSKLDRVRIRNNRSGSEKELKAEGAFIFIGLTPNSAFLKGSGVALDRWGFIVTGHNLQHLPGGFKSPARRDPFMLETSLTGVFAAGDIRDASTKQVVSAAGEGSAAALMIREYLKTI